MDPRPNIIFITADELAYDALASNGNLYADTPNIDGLTAAGTVFERAYCASPACVPARTSWMTGFYGSETGVPFNDGEVYGDIPDLGEYLRKAGYHTGHSGKWDIPGRDTGRGFEVLYEGKRKIPAGGGEIYDSCTTAEAVRFLKEYDGGKPFFLGVHYINPHDICEHLHSFEDRNKGIVSLTQMGLVPESELPPLPGNFRFDREETALQIVCRRAEGALIHEDIRRATREWDEIRWRCYLYYYYRLVEKADREIGCLLRGVRESRWKKNTVILFTADHGESCARHRMFQKFTLYEESVHVPLCIVSLHPMLPVRRGYRDREHLISGIDILPSVCRIAGAEIPDQLHGKSFLKLALGEEIPWRRYLYMEANCWGRAVIAGRYKLITEYIPSEITDRTTIVNYRCCRFGRSQLYDLGQDPLETENIAQEHPKLTAKLQEYIKETEDILQQRELISEYGREVFFRWRSVFYGYRIQNVNPGLSGEGKDHTRCDKDNEQAR